MTVATCPDAHVLLCLATGRLDEAAAAPVEQHLGECADCLARLEVLPVDDRLLRDAKGWAENGTRIVETPVVEQLIREMRQWPVGHDWQPPSVFWYNTLDRRVPALPRLAPLAGDGPLPRAGRYRLVRLLGAGGMGTVYLAEDPELNRQVAIKFPRPVPGVPWDLERFRREARLAAAVAHPHVCPIHDIGVDHDGPFVVMAYMEGRSLADRLRAQPRSIDVRAAVVLALQVAEGLAAIHERKIIHRDLKPGNILLDAGAKALIADFGLALAQAPQPAEADEQAVVGTPAYMAPEQLDARLGPVSERTDVYSLSVVLYQLTTGQLPFRDPVPCRLLQQILHEVPESPRMLRPEVDIALEGVIQRGMARLPDARYASAAELGGALRQWLQEPGETAPPDISPRQGVPRPQRRTLKPRWLVVLTACTLLAFALGLASVLQAPAINQIEARVGKKDDMDLNLSFTDHGALPIELGDALRFSLNVHQSSYFYVIWIDSAGEVHPVYPWIKDSWEKPPRYNPPRTSLSVPDDLQVKYPTKEGPKGMETFVFLVRDKPLASRNDLARKLQGLPRLPYSEATEALYFHNWQQTGPPGRRFAPKPKAPSYLLQQQELQRLVGRDFKASWAISYPFTGM